MAPAEVAEKSAGAAPSRPGDGTSHKSTSIRLVPAKCVAGFETAWDELAANAVAPNVFYEPWMLLPAIDRLIGKQDVRLLMIFGPPEKGRVQPLWGLFPLLAQRNGLPRLPVKTLSFWQHDFCFLTTPLLHRDHAAPALNAFWAWFERNPLGCRILNTNDLPADGAFHQAWVESVMGRANLVLSDRPRAFMRPAQDGGSYVANLATKHPDELRRSLSELGPIEFSTVQTEEQLEQFIRDFLNIDLQGSKGGADGAAFFTGITREAFRRNRAMLLRMTLGGRTIALKHSLLAGRGAFSFKIACDEAYAKYSPGLLLELENIRRVCESPETDWMDSCADPCRPMAKWIGGERRMIRQSLFSDGSRQGDFWVAAAPLVRLRRSIRRCEKE